MEEKAILGLLDLNTMFIILPSTLPASHCLIGDRYTVRINIIKIEKKCIEHLVYTRNYTKIFVYIKSCNAQNI